MKIPLLGLPNVESKAMPTPYGEISPDVGARAIGQGLGDAAQASAEIGQQYQRAKKKAEDIARAEKKEQYRQDVDKATYGSDSQAAGDQAFGVDDSHPTSTSASAPDVPYDAKSDDEPVKGFDAAFEKYGLDNPRDFKDEASDPLTNGFLNTKGSQAVKEVHPALSKLQAMRMKRAQELVGDENQRKFLDETAPMFDDVYEQFHRHTNQQIDAASQATQKGNEALALDSIANNYDAPKAVKTQETDVANMLSEHALSPEDGDAKVAAWEATVTETRLNQYVAAHNWDGAQKLFSQERSRLGPRQEHYEALIATGRIDGEAEKIGQEAIRAASDDDGKVDPGKALSYAAEKVKDGDPRLMKESRRVTEELVAHAKQAYDAQAKEVSTQAFGSYNTKGWGGMDPNLKLQLNKYNPELYDRLANEGRRKAHESVMDAAELRRIQKENNDAALKSFQLMDPKDQLGVNVDEDFGPGWGTTDKGRLDIKLAQKKAKELVESGNSHYKTEFVQRTLDQTEGIVKLKTSTGHATQDSADLKAEAGNAFDQFYEKNKRAPTMEEQNSMITDLARGAMLEPKKKVPLIGIEYGGKTGLEFQRRAAERRAAGEAAKKEPSKALDFGEGLDLSEPKAKPQPLSKQVPIVNSKGKVKYANEAGLDEWLKQNTHWKRK